MITRDQLKIGEHYTFPRPDVGWTRTMVVEIIKYRGAEHVRHESREVGKGAFCELTLFLRLAQITPPSDHTNNDPVVNSPVLQ